MPCDCWRIMPARNISRWETISASLGFSLRMGTKKRDRRMADSGTVETPLTQAESTVFVKDGSVHSRFAAGKKPATDVSRLPLTHVSANKINRRENARINKSI